MQPRWTRSKLPAVLIGLGLLVVFIAIGSSGTNDLDTAFCRADNNRVGGTDDCADEGRPETISYIVGGGMVAVGLLGLMMGRAADQVAGSASAQPEQSTSSVSEELERASALHASGALSDEEFAALKRQILGTDPPETRPPG